MRIGVPKEIKAEEKRVAMTPSGVAALTAQGHQVTIERGAGLGSGITDLHFRRAGARIATAREVWRAEMVVKVKEPLASEYRYLRPDLILFTYLHLASSRTLTRALMRSGVTGVAYETIQLEDGSLPLLAPMSEVAGRLAVQVGAWCLEAQNGGSGVLLSGASGVRPAKVVVLGGGIAGGNACQIAAGMGAQVSVIERNPNRLRYLHDVLGGQLTTLMSNRANIEEEVRDADLVIATVLIPGAKAPRLVTRRMVRSMRPGSAIVDVSIDQGGCVETARPTSHRKPIYVEEKVVHYAVTNMPGIVPHTSTYALTNATLQYALLLANRGLKHAVQEDAALRRGINVRLGKITHEAVAAAFGLEWVPVEKVL